MSDQAPPDDGGDGPGTTFGSIQPIEIQEEMEQSFLDYAMSVITMRALPDARDGLKPVHRRILWTMFDSGVRPDRDPVKCARVVGDVMGKYHPHGDQAIYDALVRLGQHFSVRHLLIDPQGNFGSPSDPPAAMRYCVTGDTLVGTSDGTVRIAHLADAEPSSDVDIDRKVLDRRGRPVRATKFFHSGSHPTLRLRTREGFELTGTPNHPVLCIEPVAGVPMLQWKLLEELRPGDRVVIRRDQDPALFGALDDDERALALLAGALVSEGFVSEERAGCDNTDAEYLAAVVDAFDRVVGGPRYIYDRVIASGSRLCELDVQNLDALEATPLVELRGARSAHKRVPRFVWERSVDFKRVFLQALYEGDGSVSLAPRRSVQLCYSTRSEGLARDVQALLLEFGVVAKRYVDAQRGEHRVVIANRRDARLFASRVGFFGRKQRRLIDVLDAARNDESTALSHDHIPFLSNYIRSEAGRGGLEWLKKHNIDRIERWERDYLEIIDRIADPEVRAVVEPLVGEGYYYAVVDSVTDAGVQPVYSIRVDSDDHSFLTNGFVSHNTECRLTNVAMRLLDGINEDTVDFADNYDGRDREPTVLPARFPNLLVNGSQGIAVGMATNIPPHNLAEVIDATVHLIDNPGATPDDLMQFVKGPDFPTGAHILGRQGIIDAYRTGRGSIKLRAVAEIVEGKRGEQIVVTEIPYQTSVEQIAEKAAELVDKRELEGIRDIRNESAKGKTRLVFELKRDATSLVVMNNLYKHTPMQTNFAVNMVALVDGVPRTLNLASALRAYVDHQKEVVTRRSEYRLDKAQKRAHIVEGLLRALDQIDAIITLIRGSADRPAAREGLMAEPFEFSEVQANHILDMTLGRLTRLGREELETEMAELRQEIGELEAILASEEKLKTVVKDELGVIKGEFAQERRSAITLDPGEFDLEDLIEDEELVVTLSAKGYVKTMPADTFRTQGRGGRGVQGVKLRDEDYLTQLILTTAHAYLLFFSNRGKVYRLKAHEIPMKERTARGTAIVNLLQLGPDERIQAIIDTRDYETHRFLFFATKNGQVKKTKFTEYDSSLRAGIIAINLRDDDELVRVIPTNGGQDIFMVSRKGMTIRFAEDEVRPMGRSAAGVRGMKLRAGDEVVSCDVVREDADLLIVTDAGYGKRTKVERFSAQGRGGQGVKGIKLTVARGQVVAAFMVGLDDEVFVVNSAGVAIRMPVREISSQGRDATGVRVMSLENGQSVSAVAPVLQHDED